MNYPVLPALQQRVTETPDPALVTESDSPPVHTLETLAELGKELAERAKGTMGPVLSYCGREYLEAYAAVMEGRAAV